MDVTAMLFTRMNSAPTAKREQRDLSTTVKITDPFSTREGHRQNAYGGCVFMSENEAADVNIASVSSAQKSWQRVCER